MSCRRRFPSLSPSKNLRPPFLSSLLSTAAAPAEGPSYISEDLCLNLLSHCNSHTLDGGLSLHSPIIKLGLQGHRILNNRLLSLYSKCRGPHQTRTLFDEIPHRDSASWATLISAHTRSGLDETAVELFEQMPAHGETPNEFAFSSTLRSASALKSLDLGTRVHARIEKLGHGSNVVLCSALVDLYSKCGETGDASQAFELMGFRDSASWTAMISASVIAEDWSGGTRVYVRMLESRTPPNEFTFAKLLTAGGFLGSWYGAPVHAQMVIWGAQLNLVLKTALVDMYCKCREMGNARKVMLLTRDSDVTLWTALISGYSQAGSHESAIAAFEEMGSVGVFPNSFTYASVLHACASLPAPLTGKKMHSRVVKSGLEHDASVGNALTFFYTTLSSDADDTVRAFEAIAARNVVSWTALIAGFVRHGRDGDAMAAFSEMRASGVRTNTFTLSTLLNGCNGYREARKLHGHVLKGGPASWDTLVVGNSLVDVYARFANPTDAWNVFRSMPRRDVITYSSLATGLNQTGLHQEALDLIARMRDEEVKMDGFALAGFLSAAAGLAAVELGRQLHCHAANSGLACWISVSNSLVDMYAKCGSVGDARSAFAEIRIPNVVSWNGLISGLASNGRFLEALSAFEDMVLAGAAPDGVTFLVVLYACSHGGLVDLGVEYFNSMAGSHGVDPRVEHYVCLVDLLGRAGRLEAAVGVIETMPVKPDVVIYKTLLGACKLHGDLVLGESMARRAMEMDPSDPAIYVLLAGMYDDAGKAEWGEQTRMMMRGAGTRKCIGQSWIEITR